RRHTRFSRDWSSDVCSSDLASQADPDDAWQPGDCRSIFTFPDDEKLIQQEFAKNVPFALSVAESAARPDRPVSALGLEAADFTQIGRASCRERVEISVGAVG